MADKLDLSRLQAILINSGIKESYVKGLIKVLETKKSTSFKLSHTELISILGFKSQTTGYNYKEYWHALGLITINGRAYTNSTFVDDKGIIRKFAPCDTHTITLSDKIKNILAQSCDTFSIETNSRYLLRTRRKRALQRENSKRNYLRDLLTPQQKQQHLYVRRKNIATHTNLSL